MLPEVTACEAERAPVAYSTDEPSVSAQNAAVPVPVTEPEVIAGTITRRPSNCPCC